MNQMARQAGTFRIGGDMEVCRMGYGAMRLTGEGVWGPPDDREEARRVLRRAIELGIDLIDTADAYGPEVNEEIIAEALFPYPEGLVIATKVGNTRPGPGQWVPDGRPGQLRARCEESLRRLRLEQIPLLQLHFVDPKVPEDDQYAALAQLQKEGKVRHLGLSNVSVEQIERAERHFRVTTVQNRYNVMERSSDDVVDYCAAKEIGFLPWFPLSTGKLATGGVLSAIAESRGATAAQVALAWLLQRSPVMLPIPGTSKLAHLEENTAAAAPRLTDEEMRRLGELGSAA
ncbi:MAG: aldo/keto reductase [Thermoanaerobaculia bacterium]